jgi:hypothetical protein
MDPTWRYRHGIRPTLRHLMILVLAVAMVSASVAPLVRPGSSPLEWVVAGLTLAMSPALLAVLVFVLDRPGPSKNWLAGMIASLTLPALVVCVDGVAWWFDLFHPWIWLLVPINAMGLIVLVRLSRRLPARCPECRLRSLLPLSKRATGLWWCASCGYNHRGERDAG